MSDEQKNPEEEAEVEAHRQSHPRQSNPMSDDDDAGKWSRADDESDEVEGHSWSRPAPGKPSVTGPSEKPSSV